MLFSLFSQKGAVKFGTALLKRCHESRSKVLSRDVVEARDMGDSERKGRDEAGRSEPYPHGHVLMSHGPRPDVIVIHLSLHTNAMTESTSP